MAEQADVKRNNTQEEQADVKEEQADVEQADTHEIEVSVASVEPARIYAGGEMILRIVVSCASGCDLRGGMVEILAEGVVLNRVELTGFDEVGNMTDECTLPVPMAPGEYTWTVAYAPPEEEAEDEGAKGDAEDVSHGSCSVLFPFTVLPHTISLSSWGAPSPIELESTFTLQVGARCSVGCNLAGEEIEIYDAQGVQVTTGTLGSDPWRDTAAMYWTKLELQAPGEEGFHKWDIKCPEPALELAHEESVHTFAFRTARPPEHVVIVEVVERRNKAPIKKALAVLHSGGISYRGYSDNNGIVRMSVPEGEYEFTVLASHHRTWMDTVEVSDEVSLNVELIFYNT